MPAAQQDWFAANAPKADAGVDWFASNAPAPTTPPRPAGLATIGDQVVAKGGTRAPVAGRGSNLNLQGSYDFVGGVRAGAASTMYGGGDLIRRGVGMERVIDRPDVQAAMTAPDSPQGRAGFLIEQGAEAAIPLARVARAVRGAPLLWRMAAEGGAAAGVTGIQSGGDPATMAMAGTTAALFPVASSATRMTVDAARRAAAGAREGGMGGAIASAVRTAAPAEPKAMLVQAIKPRAFKVQFPQSLDRAMPEIKAAEAVLGKPIENIDEMLQATKAAKANLQQQLNTVRGTAQGLEIDGSAVADAMTRSIPKKLTLENPAAAQQLAEAANVYRQRFSLDDMETLLRETNADLEGFYALYPPQQRKALLAHPRAAALEAQGKALRQAIDSGLDRMAEGGGVAAKELRRRYGALLDVEGEAFRRGNVAARQQPESLSEQIGAARAAADIARGTWRLLHFDISGAADIAAAHAGRSTAKAIKESQTTDALIKRAFAGYSGTPAPIQMPTRRPIAGLLERGPIVTPPAADASFVRGVPAMPAQSVRPALPPASPTTHMPAAETSGGRTIQARRTVQRDPRTGQFKVVFVSDGQ